jgi:hypothetical protein
VSATGYTILGLIIAALGTIVLPYALDKRKDKKSIEYQESVDSRAVAQMFKDERDRLQLRLDTMQADYERKMRAVRQENAAALAAAEATWKVQHDKDQEQIAELRIELSGLYRQLYQNPPAATR